MATVEAVVARPDGTPWPYETVQIGLLGLGMQANGTIVAGIAEALTDATGFVAVNLPANKPGELYVWTNPDGQQLTFGPVPDTGTIWLTSLVTSAVPTYQAAVTVAQLNAAIAAATIGGGTGGAVINDNAASSSSVYSSAKVNALLAAQLTALLDSAPTALNTLGKIAAAINDDAEFAATITAALAAKAPINSPNFTGTPEINGVAITTGGGGGGGTTVGDDTFSTDADGNIIFTIPDDSPDSYTTDADGNVIITFADTSTSSYTEVP